MTITRTAKKAITPKQKKVTVLSVVGPARPTPFSASAAGAPTSIRAQIESRAATVRFTAGNLPHPAGARACRPRCLIRALGAVHRMRRRCRASKPSSSGSCRGSPSSCRSPPAATCGSCRRCSAGKTPGPGFTAVIQLGTMAAVLIYFRADLWRIALAWLRELRVPIRRASSDARLGWFIVLGTIPISIFGIALQRPDRVRRTRPLPDRLGADPLLLRDAPRRAGRHPQRELSRTMNGRDGFFIGMSQALALIPGVSRSGSTISAGLLRGFDRVAAARYSFLLSIPAVVLSGLFELRKIGEEGSPGVAATVDRHPGRLRHRLRGDRLADPLPRQPQPRDLRRLPARPRRARPRPGRERRDQLSCRFGPTSAQFRPLQPVKIL